MPAKFCPIFRKKYWTKLSVDENIKNMQRSLSNAYIKRFTVGACQA